MKKMYRVVLLTGLAVLPLLALAGCGGKEDPTVDAAPAPAPNASAVTPVTNKNMPSRPGPGKMAAPASLK